jgi:hypothetical protein
MIVWGGFYNFNYIALATGGRYDPLDDSWTATADWANRRLFPVEVWTGREMIVWGGLKLSIKDYTNTGGRYDPVEDSWAETSTVSEVPDGRWRPEAVWTGTEMIVWGGSDPYRMNTGGRYDVATDTWAPTSTDAGVPSAREHHTTVWTGREMIVWGGIDGPGYLNGYPSGLGLYCACEGGSVNTWYPDIDGDGHGVGSASVPSCAPPSDHVTVGGDCDDTNADIYSGAAELNDGLDNQCPGDLGHGIVDEISGSSGFHNPVDRDEFSWTAQTGATDYEVARSTDPRFAIDCVVHATVATYWEDGTPVPVGACFHYLVRSTQPNVGSWGADSEGVERTPVCP